MKYMKGTLVLFISILTLGVTEMNVFGFLGFGNTKSWKEEVLLHDGSTVIVERTQTYGGYPTLESRERKLLEEEWTFTMPDSKQRIKWKNDAHRPPEGMSLTLILLDFLNNTPYIATVPAGCISYNYWGRPNPPYVFFKLNGDVWQRITLAEFPADFKETNVVIGRPDPPNRSGKLCIAKIK